MKLIIVEKPSVGQSVAKVIGATTRKDGYIEGNGYIVSWCIGHLLQLASADTYDEKYKKWDIKDLPIIPSEFRYSVSEDKGEQLKIVCDLMNRNDVEYIVNGCDAGREGELIFRLVYNYSNSSKHIKRLWVSSMEDTAIANALNNLRDGKEFENLYKSALCRLQADWIVGVNGTRLFSSLYGQTLNVGRVMSPTLEMIVERNDEILEFKPKPFYNIIAEKDGTTFSSNRFENLEEVEELFNQNKDEKLIIKNIESKEKATKPPKLYDLTSLQREANRYLGFTASQTLSYLQSLYEKKICTYPRTDSNYLSDDMLDSLKELSVLAITCLGIPEETDITIPMNYTKVINNSKVTDHHAIIPTLALKNYDLEQLSKSEKSILELVLIRFLSAIGDIHKYGETIITVNLGNIELISKGQMIIDNGFKQYQKLAEDLKNSKEEESIPNYENGQIIEDFNSIIKDGKTTAPRNFTEDTLLYSMETANKKEEVDDEFCGIGTPSTRANIIEKLINTQYLERHNDKKIKYLMPTKKGISVSKVLPENIKSALTTAEWEEKLKNVEVGTLSYDDFMSDIVEMVTELSYCKRIENYEDIFPNTKTVIGTCPRCGSNVVIMPKSYTCCDNSCKFTLWKNNKFFTNKKKELTDKVARDLLNNGRTKLTNCHSEKTGKKYNAIIIIDDTGEYVNFKMEFENGKR